MANESITFLCPACAIKLTIPGNLAGITGPCPSCGTLIQAPYPAPYQAAPAYQPPPAAPAPITAPIPVPATPDYQTPPQVQASSGRASAGTTSIAKSLEPRGAGRQANARAESCGRSLQGSASACQPPASANPPHPVHAAAALPNCHGRGDFRSPDHSQQSNEGRGSQGRREARLRHADPSRIIPASTDTS